MRRDEREHAPEPSRRDPDHGEVRAVDPHRAADEARIELLAPPHRIRRDRDLRARTGPFLVSRKGPAGREADPERLEVVRRHDRRECLARELAVADPDGGEAVCEEALKHAAAVAQVQIGGIGEIVEVRRFDAIAIEDRDQRIDPSLPGLQDQRVDDRKDRGVGADAERQDADRNGGKSRRAAGTDESRAGRPEAACWSS